MGMKLISWIVSTNPHRRPWHHALDRLTMDGVTAWISTSEAGKAAYIKRTRAPAERIFVVPTGIADQPEVDETQRRRARARWKIEDGTGPILAVAANVREAKGHGDLIEAIAMLKPKFPNLLSLCAGRDETGGRIAAQARQRGVEAHFRWLGFVPEAAVTLYPAADLVVLPSHWEGMPHALIEALRAGLPSVATDVGGNREVIGHECEGLLCPPGRPQALAETLERTLSRPDIARNWGLAARRRFENHFRVEIMIERLTEIYECLNGRGLRPLGA
jgi:glycosyltransferase involved in cell wall biosynthesis